MQSGGDRAAGLQSSAGPELGNDAQPQNIVKALRYMVWVRNALFL
jgi:hypothetical protein